MKQSVCLLGWAAFSLAALCTAPHYSAAAEQITINGSSTVYPYARAVAESIVSQGKTTAPARVVSTGTGAGIDQFCSGDAQGPDIVNASRRMKASELETCTRNGHEVVEFKIGYDAIVLAKNKQAEPLSLSRKDVYLALASKILDDSGMNFHAASPYATWKDVNPTLPASPIQVLGPPLTTGTRDTFAELVMLPGCLEIPYFKTMQQNKSRNLNTLCQAVRRGAAFTDVAEEEKAILGKMEAEKEMVGIMNYRIYQANTATLQALPIEGVLPDFANVESGDYPLTRPLYFYVKKERAQANPAIAAYLDEFTSDAAIGPNGYAVRQGLVPANASERAANIKASQDLPLLKLP